MIPIQIIRNKPEEVKQLLAKRKATYSSLVDQVLQIDEQKRAMQTEQDAKLSESNKINKEIGKAFKVGDTQLADSLKQQSLDLKETLKALDTQYKKLEQQFSELMYMLPNVPSHEVPEGSSEDANEVVFESDKKVSLVAGSLPHWELAQKYQLIDFELGTQITGAGFPVYTGQGAKLQRALINFFLDSAAKEGYYEVQPPLLVNEASGTATGQLPDKEGQMYHVGIDDLYLIPTAEVPITNLFRGQVVKESDLPIKRVGYTPCFRREAGSYGAHVRGLNRLHQFDKVEIVQVAHPGHSYNQLNEMVAYVQTLLSQLELPYRILKLCAGDLGFASAMTFDFEVYSAAQERWLEVSSVSNFEGFQSNRLKLRYKNKEGKNELAHTLNGSAMALPRIVAALLENNQTPQGIVLPPCLVPYFGSDRIL